MEHRNAWKSYTDKDVEKLEALASGYIDFISTCKTERECTARAIEMAKEAGYVSLEQARLRKGKKLTCGDKIYVSNHGKSLVLFQMGSTPLEEGFNILGAHIDSPRMDIKQNPLYEAGELAFLDTHYYGGIKKYQWVTIPLAIHGVVAKEDGSVIAVNVGEDASDPVFYVTDLLVHLSADQLKKEGSKVVEGENLDVLVGSRPLKVSKADAKAAREAEESRDDGTESTSPVAMAAKEPVKAMLVKLLQDKYGFDEADFMSAELEVVPAGRARNCGFDSSMVLGYGQDDRVCAYTSLIAQLESKDVKRSAICILSDKEEIGSVGATGMASLFFENALAEIMDLAGCPGELSLRRALAASDMLSSDVSAAFDPAYASAFETKNAAYCGHGIVFNKYTGARGKSGSNDSDAEYVAKIRGIMDKAGVAFQTAELGRVDQGGGGTIAYMLAKYGMDVIDCGVAVLSMHAPWEVTSKADIFETKKGYEAFLKFS